MGTQPSPHIRVPDSVQLELVTARCEELEKEIAALKAKVYERGDIITGQCTEKDKLRDEIEGLKADLRAVVEGAKEVIEWYQHTPHMDQLCEALARPGVKKVMEEKSMEAPDA